MCFKHNREFGSGQYKLVVAVNVLWPGDQETEQDPEAEFE